MLFFPNTQIHLFAADSTGVDDYGTPDIEYTYKSTVPADVQPLTPESSQKIFGKILQDTFKVYLDKTVNVSDSDVIKINNETFEIIGSPMKNNHLSKVSHIKLIIKKHRQPMELNIV